MSVSHTIPSALLVGLVLQAALAGAAHAQQGAVFYDSQTEKGASTSSTVNIEGMAWGYFYTGALAAPLTISAADPVVIQLYDQDQGERNVGGSDDLLQLWQSDTDLTAAAGESIRFEFFSVVPGSLIKAAKAETREGSLEIRAAIASAPDGLASTWNSASWPSSGRTFQDRAASFDGYPAADHVVRLYYVHAGQGFGGLTPGGVEIDPVAESGNKKISARAFVSDNVADSGTTEHQWDTAGVSKGMTGTLIVENTSDREGLTVNLDFLELYDEDDTSANDTVGEGSSSAPSDFNLGPGGTIKWVISVTPEWSAIEDARDLIPVLEGDLDLRANFSVSGDPELPIELVSAEEFAFHLADQPASTFTFGAAEDSSELPPPPVVAFSGGAETYFVDEDVNITCTVTDSGGGIAFDDCADIAQPAWVFEAGINTFTASAFDLYGQEGSDTVSFEVLVDPDSLIAITERFVDHAGIENSLVKKIEAAGKAKTDTAQDAACEAFIHEVEAQSGKYVDEVYAEVLIYWAEQLELQ